MQNIKLLIAVIGGTLVLVLAVAFLFSDSGEKTVKLFDVATIQGDKRHMSAGAEATASAEATSGAQPQELVTVVEFSDFQCPACRGAQPFVKQVVEKDFAGKVRLIYRHFPLESIHEYARLAAMASEAADRQGKFWEYHDVLFEKQDDWVEAGDVKAQLVTYAKDLGLDTAKFEADLESAELKELVDKDIADGFALDVNSTPTFFIENEKVSLNNLGAAINQRLNQ